MHSNLNLYTEFSFPVGDAAIVFFSDVGLSRRGVYSSIQHSHDFNEVICILSGCASIQIGGTTYELNQGDTVLIPTDLSHCFQTQNNTFCSAISFWHDREHPPLSPICALTEKKEITIFRKFKAAAAFDRMLDYYYGDYTYKNELITSCLREIITMMLENTIEKKPIPSSNATLENSNYRHYLIGQYLQDNFNNSPSLGALSRLLHLSIEQTERTIKRIYGVSFREQIVLLKVSYAKQLLSDTHMPINEIATSLGYSMPHAFSNIFKSRCGMTPLQYRKEQRKFVSDK